MEPRSNPRFILLVCFSFFPIRDWVCITLPLHRCFIVDIPEDEVVIAPYQAAVPTLVVNHHSWCRFVMLALSLTSC